MNTTTTLPSVDNTLGALYIGIVISMALWGAGSVQMYYYYNKYPKDPWQLKSLVAFVWILDSVHQGLVTHAGYIYLITEYANVAYLNVIVPTMEIMVLFNGIVALSVQSFLIYRVFILSERNYFLVIPLLALSLMVFGCTMAYFVLGVQFQTFAEVPSIAWLSKTLNALAAADDVIIAAVLIFLLHRVRTGFRKSDTIINRLIMFTINTGALTSICALCSVTFVSLWPDTFIYIAVFISACKLYCNSLLATLNYRRSNRPGMYSSSETPEPNSITPRSRVIENNQGNPARQITIQVETSAPFADDGVAIQQMPSWSDIDHETYQLSDMKASLSRA